MARTGRSIPSDRVLALALTVIGGAGLLVAVSRNWNAQEMNPGIEGALTAGILAPILALANGLGYRRSVALSAPIVVIQYSACLVAGGPALAVASLTLCCAGFLGFLVALFEPEPRRAPSPRAARPDLARAGDEGLLASKRD